MPESPPFGEPVRSVPRFIKQMARGGNAKVIWQDLVDDHGFNSRYASLTISSVLQRESSTPALSSCASVSLKTWSGGRDRTRENDPRL